MDKNIITVGQLIAYLKQQPTDALIKKLSTCSNLLDYDGGLIVDDEIFFDKENDELIICV